MIWIFAIFHYIWVVQYLVCPICSQQGLLESVGQINVKDRNIVHENENYQHIKIGSMHFLARTGLNIREEIGLKDEDFELVMN